MLHEIKVYFDSTRQARLGLRWTARCVAPGCRCYGMEAEGGTAEQAQAALGFALVEWKDRRRSRGEWL